MINPIFAAASGPTLEILITLFIMLAAAKIAAEVFERLKQPAVVGEILAGVIIGGSVLGWVAPSDFTNSIAEIGVIFLLFMVGLETKPSAIFQVGKSAVVTALIGVVAPFAGGYLLMQAWGGDTIESLFIGTAMVATSIGITARVLSAMNVIDSPAARIIIGAAVIDDILGLLLLAIVSSTAQGGVDYLEIGTTAALAIGFTIFVALVGARVLNRLAPRIERFQIGHSFFIFGLVLCLGLSVAAAYIGMAAIIGAFLAGMAMAEASENNHEMHSQTGAVTEFLVPFFLVNIGMQLKLEVFQDLSVVALAVAVTLIALLTKFVAGLSVIKTGWRRAAQIGVGMSPRGEVGIVVAQIGFSLAVISDALYGVVLFMSVATTLVAPPLLKWLFAGEQAKELEDDDQIVPHDEDLVRIG